MSSWMDRPLRERLMSIMDAEANETAATLGEAIDRIDQLEACLRALGGDAIWAHNMADWHDTGRMQAGVQRWALAALEKRTN